jgi:hypothetical protein
MADWKFVIATTGGVPLVEARLAMQRSVTWKLHEGAVASCVLHGADPAAYQVVDYQRDLLIYRNKVLMFRGRILGRKDDLDGTSHTVSFSAVDYRGWITQVRYTQATLTYTGQTKRAIAEALVAHTQGLPGGALGIVPFDTGMEPAGTHDRTYEPDKSIGAAITDLGESINPAHSYEWEIGPDMRMRIWSPTRGVVRAFVAEYGNTITGGSRDPQTGEYGNVVAGQGSTEDTTRYVATAADLASRPEGRIERLWADQDIKVQATLEDRTDARLAQAELPVPGYQFNLAPRIEWNPDELFIGDTTKLVVQVDSLNVVTSDRIEELKLDVGDDGGETVALTWGRALRQSNAIKLREAERRLDRLERL